MKKEMTAKSVRLPSDLVEFIEQKDGRDFSKKLVAILEDYRDGDENRKKEILFYNGQLELKRNLLREYQEEIYKLSKISGSCSELVTRLRSYMEEKEHDKLPRDANLSEVTPEESELLETYRKATERFQKMILRQAKILANGDGIPPPS